MAIPQYQNDTILFRNMLLSTAYHQEDMPQAGVVNGKFSLPFTPTYPHMYRVGWKSEWDNVISRSLPLFIDSSTTTITIDDAYSPNGINGKAAEEYVKKFIPFAIPDSLHLDEFIHNKPQSFDNKLNEYITTNPDSYVALWFLVIQFNENGYLPIYETMLKNFSKKIKTGQLWKALNDEFSVIQIKMNKPFPKLVLKNLDLEQEEMMLPKSEYTLIEIWWSRCKPCLEQMPHWQKLYSEYKNKRFNVIAISSDKTTFIDNWKKRINERGFVWKNYLDENAVFLNSEKIYSFPTNFLLDKNGTVIRKNISHEEMKQLLDAI